MSAAEVVAGLLREVAERAGADLIAHEEYAEFAVDFTQALSEHGYSIVPTPTSGEPPSAPELRQIADSLERIAHWRWPDDRADCPSTANELRHWADQLGSAAPAFAAAAAAEEDTNG